MQNFEIPIPGRLDCATVEVVIDRALSALDLKVTLRGSLKKYPGCVHWHAKSGRRPGTLEITLWPQKRRAWFTIQSGRRGDWIEATMAALADEIQSDLDLKRD